MPKRTRQIDDSRSHPVILPKWTSQGTLIQDWGQWGGPSTLYRFPQQISEMEDVVGNQGSFNPVNHQVLNSTMSNFNSWPQPGEPDRHVNFDGVALPLAEPSFIDWPWLPVISSASLSDWAVDAYNAFHDQVPTTVSLPNFLYELREMKSLIPSIDRRSISKTASNNFLAFQFGWQPMVKDIKAILNLSDSVQKRIKILLEQQEKTTKLSFNRDIPLEEPFSFMKSCYDAATSHGDTDVEFQRVSAKAKFHCGASLYQDLSDLDSALGTMKALSASGGFNKPARVVWNAIPYSFVVDWFFHVGKILDTLSVQPFGGTYKVSDIGYSVKSEAVFIASQVFHNGSTVLKSTLGTIDVRGYVRRPGFPVSSLFITGGSLSPMQQALSLAMLEQRRH